MKETIVGLVGYHSSGKGTVAEILEKDYGFFQTSLSDRIREEASKRGESWERQRLRSIGNELRAKFGPDVLVRRTWEIIEAGEYKKVVIDSVRNPAEVRAIKGCGGIIIYVNASPEKRLELMVNRGRDGDAKNMIDLKEMDRLEDRSEDGDHVQNIAECIKAADIIMNNNGTRGELQNKIRDELAPQLSL